MMLWRPLLMTVNICVSYVTILIYMSWSCTGRRFISHVHVPQHYCYLIIITITIINVAYYMFMYTSVVNNSEF